MATLQSLSAEVILRILGQAKDAKDIVRFRQVNKRMYSLGHDSLLWKELFIDTFLTNPSSKEEEEGIRPSKRARKTSHDEEDIQTLPARALTSLPSIEDDNDRRTDWHALYRISWNWKKGSFNIQQLNAAMQMAQKSNQSDTAKSKLDLPNTIIESTEKYIFTAVREPTSSAYPEVSVFPAQSLKRQRETNVEEVLQVATYSSSSLSIQDNASVSAIAIDRENADTDRIRLITGYTNGLLSMSTFCPSTKVFHELTSYRQTQHPAIVTAAFAWPFVATCTIDFRIRIYRMNEEDSTTTFRLLAERRSYSCHWPACLRLERAKQTENTFRLSIVYSNPIYPSGWSIGLQELYLDNIGVIDSRSASAKRSHVVTKIDAPSKALYTKNSSTRTTSIDQVGRLTSLSYEEPFVVVGSRDNGVFCFRVDELKDDPNYGSKALSIRYLRTLHGHTGSVHSVSLNGGRCVTGGSDGKVQVWYLGDEEVSIARATGVISMLKGRIRSNLGKVTSLRLSDARSERKRGQKRKLSDATNSEDSSSNSKPLTLADIRQHHILPLTKSPFTSQPMHVIRWVTSAFDRIISVTSNERYRQEDGEHSAILPSSCRAEAQNEKQNGEESVQIWNFAA
ncbi:uncharacterized protein FA14DRAFT_159865 [Meira miltonrushii]|uniref:F-box domain-containing protein n=1 Tax=Meira miltonrushii TaxID=1280837 RepID=A0A316VKK9_9BASI|nr:uncharacterized protein FA14DRAFT_159865 [Meira miltonrushii]PWN38159.1 hypothetical protein FA14DRAFT_159865 [Meira miltonrushii]